MFQPIAINLPFNQSLKYTQTPKVRGQSFRAGKCESTIWKPISRQDTKKTVLAAKRYERINKQFGQRNGPLGHIAIEVLELLANLVDFKTGRLEPSIDTIMRKTKRSRDAVVRALKALRQNGFLNWIRRYEETGTEERGPQRRQVSNAYRLSVPPRAVNTLGRFFKTPPLPDDVVQVEADRKAFIDEYRNGLQKEERVLFDVGDNPLGQALARLARNMSKQRESAKQTEY